MSRADAPPFEMGRTWYDGPVPEIETEPWEHVLGVEFVFDDYDPHTGVDLSDKQIRCRCVRNCTGDTLRPKVGIVLDGKELRAIETGPGDWVVDKHAVEVPPNDIFYATKVLPPKSPAPST